MFLYIGYSQNLSLRLPIQLYPEKYGNRVKLLYSDTDSLIYHFVEDIYEEMKKDNHLIDTSNYPQNNVFKISLANKKVLDKMKDEMKGEIILEFIDLR